MVDGPLVCPEFATTKATAPLRKRDLAHMHKSQRRAPWPTALPHVHVRMIPVFLFATAGTYKNGEYLLASQESLLIGPAALLILLAAAAA